MRRLAVIFGLLALGGALLATSAPGQGGPSGDYEVRGYFDNAGFLVKGEEVRIAGAKVGQVAEVDVSQPGERVREDGREDPGRAVVVMEITDPAFQDFRTDASCLIRPQSLLGEKFVECTATQPRSSLSDPPPQLEVIPEGQVGAGQLFLPLENNGKQVDLDLLNNITREPEVDRFRLILNDLGAGLAARGDDLGEVIERGNPALRETDEVLRILAEQNRGLARLASDSDSILAALARERDSVAGFINNATTTGQAAAERREDIEAGFAEFPAALDELELTMVELRRFAEEAQPVAADLRVAAPSLAGATRALGPFSRAGTPALTTLGEAAEDSEQDLLDSRPVIRDLGQLGEVSAPGGRELNRVLSTLRRSGGLDQLYSFIVNFGSAINGFDDFGHFLRASIQINNCLDIAPAPKTGCGARWTGTTASAAAVARANPTDPDEIDPAPGAEPTEGEPSRRGAGGERGGSNGSGGAEPKSPEGRAALDLLEFLTEDGQ